MTNIGYGKIILLGEHFVVHGSPALVTSLDLVTQVELTLQSDPAVIIDNRPKVPTYQPLKIQEYSRMVNAVFATLGIKKSNITVTFSGTLPVTNGGIGASAAAAVALARAISNKFNLNLSDEQINNAAFCGEKEVHGTPSGIDNSAAVYSGLLMFQKTLMGNMLTPINKKKIGKLFFVIADSGRPTNIKQVLANINKNTLQDLIPRYTKLFEQAHAELIQDNLIFFGQAMIQNHMLLQELGVSSPELDTLVSSALSHGALGAKLTGTGCGGLMIALAPNQKIQENIAHAFKTDRFFTIVQNI